MEVVVRDGGGGKGAINGDREKYRGCLGSPRRIMRLNYKGRAEEERRQLNVIES